MDEALAGPRLYASLVGAFAVLAAALAVIGIYGLVAFIVAQREHEIGVRMALGAARDKVFRAVLAQGLSLIAAGLAIGMIAAVAARGAVSSLLFGVTAGDPATYTGAASLFLIASIAVAAIPAYRAARIDPVSALRQE